MDGLNTTEENAKTNGGVLGNRRNNFETQECNHGKGKYAQTRGSVPSGKHIRNVSHKSGTWIRATSMGNQNHTRSARGRQAHGC